MQVKDQKWNIVNGTNAESTTESLKQKRNNNAESTLVDRSTEGSSGWKRAKLSIVPEGLSELSNRAVESVTEPKFDLYDANTWDDTESTRSKLNEQVSEILTLVNETEQNISQNPHSKAAILLNLFQKARLFVDQHPAKRVAFEFLHTQDPDNEEFFEKFGAVLEGQDLKAAKALYVKGLSNDKLFKRALNNIKLIMRAQQDTPTTLWLKFALNIDLINSRPTALFNRTVIAEIKGQLQDPSNPIHEHLKNFIDEEVKERSLFLEN